MTWTIPASPCVSPTFLRVEFTQLCLHGGSKKHEKSSSWLRTCTFCHHQGLDQIHIEKSGEKKIAFIKGFSLTFPRDVLKLPRLGDHPLSLNSQKAPVRSIPRRKFFSKFCCNLIDCWRCKSLCEKYAS